MARLVISPRIVPTRLGLEPAADGTAPEVGESAAAVDNMAAIITALVTYSLARAAEDLVTRRSLAVTKADLVVLVAPGTRPITATRAA